MENVIISCLSYLSKEWIEVNAGKRGKDHKCVRLTLNACELEGLKVYHTLFYSLWKETHKPSTFKRGSFKKLFLQCVCYWYNLLQWIFFFHVICERHYFSWKFIINLRFFWQPCCCFLWSTRFERSSYFIRYLHNNSTMLIPKIQDNAFCFDF